MVRTGVDRKFRRKKRAERTKQAWALSGLMRSPWVFPEAAATSQLTAGDIRAAVAKMKEYNAKPF